MQNEEIKTKLQELRETAERRLRAEPEAQMVIALRSTKGGIYVVALPDWTDPTSEEALLQILRDGGDTEIEQLVCIWQHDCCLDLPSMRFRRSLLELDERNADTLVLLNGMDADGRLRPKPVPLKITTK